MEEYQFGDYVVYTPDNGRPEYGRVTEDRGSSAFVCYHQGCTAACTPKSLLRLAEDPELVYFHPMLGHHRFDEFCPDRVDDGITCEHCRAKKRPD